MLDIGFGEPRNLLIAVQKNAQTVAAGAFFEEAVNASGTPERNYIGLRDHQHGVGKIREQAGGGIETAGSVNNDKAVMINQEIEQPGQFTRRGLGCVGLLGSCQQT